FAPDGTDVATIAPLLKGAALIDYSGGPDRPLEQGRDGCDVRAVKSDLGETDVATIAPLLKGPTLIAFSGDPIAAPKVAVDFAKANERFVILGGAMGKTTLNPDGVKALAALPSLDELRAKIVGLLQAPATKLAQ